VSARVSSLLASSDLAIAALPSPPRVPCFAATTLPAPAPKVCGCCGAEHDAYAWSRLPLVGVMTDAVESIELRNCRCNSTLAVEVAS
jgi:hypothetical protein